MADDAQAQGSSGSSMPNGDMAASTAAVVRVGIVGAGANTRTKHIPLLRRIEGVSIVCVCNRTPESSQRVADEFQIPKVHSRWEDVVSDPEVDAVVIGTWPYMHQRIAVAALDQGKHVLCEARMAMDAAEAHAMLDASKRHPELVAQVVPSPISLPYDAYVQKLISDGVLGDVLYVDVKSTTGNFADESGAPLHWRHDRTLSGLNTLSMGIMYEAVQRWLGSASQVMAMSRVFVDTRTSVETGKPVRVTVPDHVDVLAQLECGAQAHFLFSSVVGSSGPYNEVFIYGRLATLRINMDMKALYLRAKPSAAFQVVTVPEQYRGSWRVEEEFIDGIRKRSPIVLTSFDTAVRYMEFTEAVALSAAERRAIALPLPRAAS